MWFLAYVACAWIGSEDVSSFEDHDGDGLSFAIDCDDADPTVASAPTWFVDADGDGWGDAASLVQACALPEGASSLAGDCDDQDAAVSPWASESCAAGDEDCDGLADDLDPQGAIDALAWFVDQDGDAYGSGASTRACLEPPGRVSAGSDCDDADPDTHPGALESCGGVDRDCDFRVDDADSDVQGQPTWYADVDGDGYGDASAPTDRCERPAGHTDNASDCDDVQAAVSPAAVELCGGGDEDCDGMIDDQDPSVYGRLVWYADADADGYGDGEAGALTCDRVGRVGDGTDCDDADDEVHPGAQEVCDAGDRDEDCDEAAEDGDGDVTGTERYYVDGDGDGSGSPDAPERWCDPPADVAPTGDDCDDLRADVHPDAAEVWYDGVDGACDQGDDYDADADGSRDPRGGGTDCDDSDPAVRPGAVEVWYDGVDQDCAGDSDFDADADGFDALAHGGDDCDDDEAGISPSAAEVWYDGVDQDCAGDDDYDADADGYRATGQPDGDDCDDDEPTTWPGAEEFMDGVDSDCDTRDFVCGDVTRRVPRDYAKPQPAFDAACPGDVVRIDPGDWVGPFVVNRNLTVEGAGPGVRLVGDGSQRVVRAGRSTWRDLEVSGGVADGLPGGAGVLLVSGTGARFERVVFRNNRSDNYGAGLGIQGSGYVVIQDSSFEDNDGLGIHAAGAPDLTVRRVAFRNNTGTTGGGGGAYLLGTGSAVLEDVTFTDNANTASNTWHAAGLMLTGYDDVVLRRAEFRENSGSHLGATFFYDLGTVEVSDVTIVDASADNCAGLCFTSVDACEISDFLVERTSANASGSLSLSGAPCHARDGVVRDGLGPGIAIGLRTAGILLERVSLENHRGWGIDISAPATLRDVEIRGNRGIDMWATAPVTLERVRSVNSLSASNPALNLTSPTIRGVEVLGAIGGGINAGGNLDIEGLVIAGSARDGFTVANGGATGRVSHATIIENVGVGVSALAPVGPDFDHLLVARNYDGVWAFPPLRVQHCAFYGNLNLDDASRNHDLSGCLRADPRFVTYGAGLDPTAMDLHLRPGSPLRDAGAVGNDRDGSPGDLGAYGGPADSLGGLAYEDDFDADGLPDGWEDRHGLDATTPDSDGDVDRDGLTNRTEYLRGTDPTSQDTDGDRREDLDEIEGGFDPLSPYDG